MYVLPTEPIIFKFLGIEVEGMIARSLEKNYLFWQESKIILCCYQEEINFTPRLLITLHKKDIQYLCVSSLS